MATTTGNGTTCPQQGPIEHSVGNAWGSEENSLFITTTILKKLRGKPQINAAEAVWLREFVLNLGDILASFGCPLGQPASQNNVNAD